MSTAYNLLNSELVTCEDDGDLIVEPKWTVDLWYDREDVYSANGKDKSGKKQTSLRFEELVQGRLQSSEELNNGRPSHQQFDARLAELLQKSSLVLFNKDAKQKISQAYANWKPQFGTRTRGLDQNPFKTSPNAKVMKLKFIKIDLPTKVFEVEVASEVNTKPLVLMKVGTDPSIECTPTSDPIPMNCFYYVVVHKNGDPPSYRRDYRSHKGSKIARLKDNDILYLLKGFHMMQANEDAWTWSTYWWTPQRRKDTFCASKEYKGPACEHPWVFYTMDEQRYIGDDATLHFNPYIEEPSSNSSCIYCHARALDHADKSPPSEDFRKAREHRFSVLLPCFKSEVSGQAEITLDTRDVDCTDAIPTHFLWTLAFHLRDHPPPTQQPR